MSLPALEHPHRLTCHCGGAVLEVSIVPEGYASARRCDCSYCRRRGAVALSVAEGDLRVVKGDTLRLYQFNTNTAEHWFCGTCGIYTHHRRRSNPHQFGVNAGCLEGVNPRDLGAVPWNDGVNHPSDR